MYAFGTERATLLVGVTILFGIAPTPTILAEELAISTYDIAAYNFLGTTPDPSNQTDPELPVISVATDYSGGVVSSANSHFVFTVIKFDDLTGIDTQAAGGPNKYLTLSTDFVPSPSVVGVTIAAEDIQSSSAGYPGHPSLFPGNPTGSSTDRLQWYMDNIKGDDATYGGYAGGAIRIGSLDVPESGDYSIDVTDIVDGWIVGSIPNYGFGLWGIDAPGAVGTTIEFASREAPSGNGPTLESLPVGGAIPGDFDSDGDVDGDDFLLWQSEFGGTPLFADGDDDGDVDGDDFLIWQSNFGSANGAAATSPAQASVPEPASSVIAALAVFAGLSTMKRRGLRPVASGGRHVASGGRQPIGIVNSD